MIRKHKVILMQNVYCGSSDGKPIIYTQGIDVDGVAIIHAAAWTTEEIRNGIGCGIIGIPREDPHCWEGQYFIFDNHLWALCTIPESQYSDMIPADEYGEQYAFFEFANEEDVIREPDAVRKRMQHRGFI